MRIYFDTEFTRLASDARLISIGLVAEDGVTCFYAEMTDTFVESDCSAFCVNHVLPLLEGGESQMTFVQLQKRLCRWLEERGPGTLLVCDSPRDVTQIRTIFPNGLPVNCSATVLSPLSNLLRRIINFRRRLHKRHGLRVHHALDDAKVNRLVLSGVFRHLL